VNKERIKRKYTPPSEKESKPSYIYTPGQLGGVNLPVAASLVFSQPVAVLVVIQRLDAYY